MGLPRVWGTDRPVDGGSVAGVGSASTGSGKTSVRKEGVRRILADQVDGGGVDEVLAPAGQDEVAVVLDRQAGVDEVAGSQLLGFPEQSHREAGLGSQEEGDPL